MSLMLLEASQYDVYCWAMDSAVNTQGLPRPNYMTQAGRLPGSGIGIRATPAV